jgi:hypothetical protein
MIEAAGFVQEGSRVMATRDMLHEAEKILGCVTVRAPVGDLAIRNVQRCVQVLSLQAALVQVTSAITANLPGHCILSESWVTRMVPVVTMLPSFQRMPPLG